MSKEDSVYNAKLAEQAERYDDMIKYMKEIVTVILYLPQPQIGRKRVD